MKQAHVLQNQACFTDPLTGQAFFTLHISVPTDAHELYSELLEAVRNYNEGEAAKREN